MIIIIINLFLLIFIFCRLARLVLRYSFIKFLLVNYSFAQFIDLKYEQQNPKATNAVNYTVTTKNEDHVFITHDDSYIMENFLSGTRWQTIGRKPF